MIMCYYALCTRKNLHSVASCIRLRQAQKVCVWDPGAYIFVVRDGMGWAGSGFCMALGNIQKELGCCVELTRSWLYVNLGYGMLRRPEWIVVRRVLLRCLYNLGTIFLRFIMPMPYYTSSGANPSCH